MKLHAKFCMAFYDHMGKMVDERNYSHRDCLKYLKTDAGKKLKRV